MKVTVDSKEMTESVSAIEKYTAPTGSAVSESVLLEATDGFLLLRSTTFKQDAVLAANAAVEEKGMAVVPIRLLAGATFDSGGPLTLNLKKKLMLRYGDGTKLGISTIGVEPSEFPVLDNARHVISLPLDIITVAARHCDKPGAGAMTIRSSIHIIHTGAGKGFVLATNGIVGFRYAVDMEESNTLSIDSAMLATAARAIGSMVDILAGKNRIEVAEQDGPRRIQFPETWSQDPAPLVAAFDLDTVASFNISAAELKRLAFLAGRASAVDEHAELLVDSDGSLKVAGTDIDITSNIEFSGKIVRSTFFARHISRSLRNIPVADNDFAIHVVPGDDGEHARLWYIDGIGRHFIAGASCKRFD